MPVIFQRTITIEELQENPDAIYLFCENADYAGNEGLARFMRGEENAHGVRLKLSAGPKGFIDDESSFEGQSMLDEDFIPLFEHAKVGGVIVVPLEGFEPTHLAEDVRDYLHELLERLNEN